MFGYSGVVLSCLANLALEWVGQGGEVQIKSNSL